MGKLIEFPSTKQVRVVVTGEPKCPVCFGTFDVRNQVTYSLPGRPAWVDECQDEFHGDNEPLSA
jgi:hypothetical protein